MTSLQTVVMGLVIVFLDIPPDGFDWIADPVGWVLVLLGLSALGERLPNRRGLALTAWACLLFSVVSWPEGSPATLTPLLGWLFSLPTLAWCFLVCDAVSDAVEGRLRWVMLGLRNAFAVVAPLPGLVYLAGQDWLSTPAEVLILVANLTLVLSLSSASSRPGLTVPEDESRGGSSHPGAGGAASAASGTASATSAGDVAPADTGSTKPQPRQKTVGFSAAEAKRKARARREQEAGSAPATPAPAAASKPTASQPTASQPTASQPTASQPTAKATDEEADAPVTGAEVIEKVRRRREAREKAQGQGGSPTD